MNKTSTQDEKAGHPKAAESDLESDQILYDLDYKGNIGSTEYEVHFGGFNLVRIYDAEGNRSSVMTVEEFTEFAEKVSEEAMNQRFRELMA